MYLYFSKSTSTPHVLGHVLFSNFRDHFIWHDDGNSNEVIQNLTDQNFDFEKFEIPKKIIFINLMMKMIAICSAIGKGGLGGFVQKAFVLKQFANFFNYIEGQLQSKC